MTKKHFKAFAEAIKNDGVMTEEEKSMCASIIAHVSIEFNPRFDYGRFFEACGLKNPVLA